MRVLVTGAAGFIGYHTAVRLLDRGDEVIGFDNLNPYYDVSLKEARLARLKAHNGFRFIKADLADRTVVEANFRRGEAGARDPSRRASRRALLARPSACLYRRQYHRLFACARRLPPSRRRSTSSIASSSSVYGANRKLPFSVSDNVDHPVSLYGATKKANELMAHSYAHLFGCR